MPNPSTAPLFVVFNIGSGAGDADEARAAIEQACAAAGRTVQLLVVDEPRRIAALAQEAVRRAREAGGIVVAAGGDGTINAVAQAVLGSGCPFGVLPQGTFNYFSRTHGIPSDTAEAALAAARRARSRCRWGWSTGACSWSTRASACTRSCSRTARR